MQCPMCGERRAEAQLYRVNGVTESIEHLCRPCYFVLRKSEHDDWAYFKGAGRLVLLYTILPVAITAVLVWLLASWIL